MFVNTDIRMDSTFAAK